ncbi:MAG: hypothetical protein KatS3mg002_0241 [Candidatus Woesearchaeota archaeon]|nr:MAG: hypothetical protein KatS3mg002_0241 [Candidatus Woesearchaeota archaeon]
MNIQITKFGAQNFSCFENAIEVELNEPKIHFIVGPNGSGKTSLLDIIPFTFYGKTSKGISGSALINNKAKKNCLTWVEFTIDNDQFRVERFYKYKGSDGANIYRNGNIIISGLKDVTQYISSFILPDNIFTNTVFFSPRSTLFSSMSDRERKDVLFTLIGLHEYEKYYEKTSQEYTKKKQEFDELDKQYKINLEVLRYKFQQFRFEKKNERASKRDLKNKIKELENEITNLTLNVNLIPSLEEKLTFLEKEKNDLIDYLNSIKKEVEEFNNQLENEKQIIELNYREKLNEMKEKATSKLSEINDQAREIERKLQIEIDNQRSELFKIQSKLQEIQINNKNTEQRIQALHNQIDESNRFCPTCKQEIKDFDEFKIHITQEIEKLKNEILKTEPIYQSYINEKTTIETNLNELINKQKQLIQTVEERKNKVKEKAKHLIDTLKLALQQELFEINSKEKKYEESDIIEYTNKINEKQKEIDFVKSEIIKLNKSQELRQQLIGKLKALQETEIIEKSKNIRKEITSQINVIRTIKKDIRKVSNELQILEFWKSAFSAQGIPAFLLDESIPFINSRIKHYLSYIEGNRYIISLDSQKATKSGEYRNKISINVLDNETLSNSLENFSSGQRRIVDILLILALSDLQAYLNNCEFNFIMFDEIFDTLDQSNIDYVKSILYEIKEHRHLFIISHSHVDFDDAIIYEM